MDSKPEVHISEIPKNYHLLETTVEEDHTLNRLAWFSDYYYGVMDVGDRIIQVNDLRYGTFKGDGSQPKDYIFSFKIDLDENGKYQMLETQAGPPNDRQDDWFQEFWARIKGI